MFNIVGKVFNSAEQAEECYEERYCLIYPEHSCCGGFMEFSDQ